MIPARQRTIEADLFLASHPEKVCIFMPLVCLSMRRSQSGLGNDGSAV